MEASLCTSPDVSSCPSWCDRWEDTQEVPQPSHVHRRQTVRGRSCCCLHVCIYSCRAKVNFLRRVTELVWGGIRGGREGPQGPPKPAPTAVTAPPDRAAAGDGEQEETYEPNLTPPRSDTLPGVVRCPVSGASPLPGCSQVVLLASSLLREEGRIIHFAASLSHHRERETGRNDRSRGPQRGNYLMKKTRPSRVTP